MANNNKHTGPNVPALRFPEFSGEWECKSLGEIGESLIGLTYSPSDVVKEGGTIVFRSSNIQNGVIDYGDLVRVSKKIKDSIVTRDGDLLICARNGSTRLIGKNALLKKSDEGQTFGAFMMVFRSLGADRKFLYWLLNSTMFGYYLGAFATSTINQLTRKDFGEMRIPNPPLPEQRKIAAFLDGECGKIDVLRGEVEKQIAALEEYRKSVITEAVTKGIKRGRKMKPSGVEWIDEVPDGWKCKRFKYVATSIRKGNGITKDEVFEDGEYPCIRYGEIYSRYGFEVIACLSKTRKSCVADPVFASNGDILFACTGELVEEIGKNVLYAGSERCVVGGDIAVASHTQNAKFLNYYLNCSLSQFQKSRNKAKLKVVHLKTGDIANLVVALPPIPEQHEIAAYLDRKCAAIDSMVAKCREELDRLAEYKKSLIYEYVTGKKEVA